MISFVVETVDVQTFKHFSAILTFVVISPTKKVKIAGTFVVSTHVVNQEGWHQIATSLKLLASSY